MNKISCNYEGTVLMNLEDWDRVDYIDVKSHVGEASDSSYIDIFRDRGLENMLRLAGKIK